jgi:hypothetical protein
MTLLSMVASLQIRIPLQRNDGELPGFDSGRFEFDG